ncbi:MAG: hypothetical protein J5758_06045 [Abditibacteriota bacterium]|nr:hypothetical protein [Abditibacteriota bacterium]
MKRPDGFSFDDIAGHGRVKERLLKLVRSPGKPNSMVFSGPEGVGKLLCANAYTAAILCQSPGDSGACGVCNSCRSLQAGLNLNVAYWFRKKQTTTISQMRHLTELAAFAPAGSRYKVNVIQDGDSLNEEASNSILKTIEDSPEYLITLILYNNPANALATIRSRSFNIPLQPLDTETVRRHMAGLYGGSPRAAFAAGACGGSIGRARLLMESSCLDEARDLASDIVTGAKRDVFSLLRLSERAMALDFNSGNTSEEEEKNILDSGDDFLMKPFEPRLAQTDNLGVFCELAALWLRDILLVMTGGPEKDLVNADRRELLVRQARAFGSPAAVTAMIDELHREQERLGANANVRLSVDGMMCRLCDICMSDKKA